MRLSDQNIVEYLNSIEFKECTLLSIRDLRNFAANVKCSSANLLVKQEGQNHSTFADVSLGNELEFYTKINSEVLPTLEEVTPKLYHIDHDEKILVIEFLEKHNTFQIGDQETDYSNTECLGQKLALLHDVDIESVQDSFGKVKMESYFRSFKVITPEMFNSGGPLFAKCVELMQRYPDLNEGIDSLQKEFVWDCFIHGDLKIDNIMVQDKEQNPELKIIDWELVGVGDRYIDLGNVIGNYLLWWIENKKFGIGSEAVNDKRMVATQNHIYHFFQGYRNSQKKPHTVDYVKLTRFTALFLLNAFYSKSLFKTVYSKQDIMLLDIARKMLINPKSIYPELFMKTIMSGYAKTF